MDKKSNTEQGLIKMLETMADVFDVKGSMEEIVKVIQYLINLVEETNKNVKRQSEKIVADEFQIHLEKLQSLYKEAINDSRNNNTEQFNTLKARLKESFDNEVKLLKETAEKFKQEKLKEIELLSQKIDDIEPVDKEAIIKETLSRVPKVEKDKEISQIRGIISVLNEEVEKLKEIINEVKERPTASGVSNLRIQQAFKYILKTEAPSGAIDGVNTEYTVSQPIFAVLSFSLNGEFIAQLPNYTISGRKIIFSSAIPSVYSGKDFEVKYI